MKYDLTNLNSAKRQIRNSRTKVEEQRDLLSSIVIPKNFFRATSVTNNINRINDVSTKLANITSRIEGVIIRVEDAETDNIGIIEEIDEGDVVIDDSDDYRSGSDLINSTIQGTDKRALLRAAYTVRDEWTRVEDEETGRRRKIVYSIGGGLWNAHDIDGAYKYSERSSCATYVAALLYVSGLVSPEIINNHYIHSVIGISQILDEAGWTNMCTVWYGSDIYYGRNR